MKYTLIALSAVCALRTSTLEAQGPMQNVLGAPMDRAASGTTWIPDAVALPSRHIMTGAWTVMLHGYAWAQYTSQRGPRGDDQFGSVNWGMVMASRSVGRGQLQLRTMLSLDAATVGGRGYPLLLQTGEEFEGEALRDRQHPHDFFKELAAMYDVPITSRLAGQFYFAASGEPALGPVAFMHRPSAMDNPVAPLGHHWQDATHISFGVATAGIYGAKWKLEASAFNGREPDDRRWNIDFDRLDSYAARLTVQPTSNWSFTGGRGRLKMHDTDGHHPAAHAAPVNRTVLSALHGVRIGANAQLASALIVGINSPAGDEASSRSVLAESQLVLRDRHTIFARFEAAQRTVAELQLSDSLARYNGDYQFNVKSASVGYTRELVRVRSLTLGAGARGTVNVVPEALASFYGSRAPLGFVAIVRLRPAQPATGAPAHAH